MLTSTNVFLHDLQAVMPPVDSKIGEFHMISWQKLHVASLAIVSKIAFTLAIFFQNSISQTQLSGLWKRYFLLK